MKIEQNATFLLELVRRVHTGQLAPAAFQRPYVWDREAVLALCTSILEGYPIGGFLSWRPGRHADMALLGRKRLGPTLLNPAEYGSALLLDGQNRLATLAWMLRDAGDPLPTDLSDAEQAAWGCGEELIADLAAQELRFVPHADADKGLKLPAAALFDSRIANGCIRKRWNEQWREYSDDERDAGLKWQDNCSRAFRDARVVETVLNDATPEQARKAFLHICRVGVPMSQDDFDAAIGWTK